MKFISTITVKNDLYSWTRIKADAFSCYCWNPSKTLKTALNKIQFIYQELY